MNNAPNTDVHLLVVDFGRELVSNYLHLSLPYDIIFVETYIYNSESDISIFYYCTVLGNAMHNVYL